MKNHISIVAITAAAVKMLLANKVLLVFGEQERQKPNDDEAHDDVLSVWDWEQQQEEIAIYKSTSDTHYSMIVPKITGSISTISSILMMYIILRSEPKLSSIYHRIMFGMCVADVIGSTAMALNTLPMPSYMPQEEDFGYKWEGPRLGNVASCNIQGVCFTFGIIVMFGYNACLCVYYACAIALGIRDKVIKKFVEPVLHMLPILCGLLYALLPLFYDLYNPGIGGFAWCCIAPYPDECGKGNDSLECIRGSRTAMDRFMKVLISFIATAIMFIVVSLPMVLWKVFQTDHLLNKLSKMYKLRGIMSPRCKNIQQQNEGHRMTKVILVQVSCYLLSSLAGIVPPMLRVTDALAMDGVDITPTDLRTLEILDKIILAFLPLQGFFNFVIFVSHKVYNYRRVDRNASISHVLSLLFHGSGHDPTIISRISLVSIDHQHQLEEGNNGEVGVGLVEQGTNDQNHKSQHITDEGCIIRLELYQNSTWQYDEEKLGTHRNGLEEDDRFPDIFEDIFGPGGGGFLSTNKYQSNASPSFPSKSSSSNTLLDAERTFTERKYYNINR